MKIKKTQIKTLTMIITFLLVLSVFCGGCIAKPPANMPQSVLWLNGTHAVYAKTNHGDVHIWGGAKPTIINKQLNLIGLSGSWGVTNKAEMDEMIDSLIIGRHNPKFLKEIEEYGIIYMDKREFDEAIKDVEDRLDVIYFQNMFDAYQRFGENAIFAWDLSRAVQLCAAGYIVGFYSYEESTAKAREIGKKIQNTFDSWDDFYASYFYGYAYWSEDDTEDKNSEYAERMRIFDALKKDENSPLHLNWYLDLSE